MIGITYCLVRCSCKKREANMTNSRSELCVYVNGIPIGEVFGICNSAATESSDNNVVTIYLKEGNKITTTKVTSYKVITNTNFVSLTIIKL